MSERTLPPGWVLTKVADILEVHYGKGLPKARRDYTGKVPVFGSNGVVGQHSSALTDGACIVIGRKGAAGAIHISRVSCWPIDTTYYTQPPAELSFEYIYYALGFLNLVSLDKSTAIPGLNRDDLYSQTVPLPPLTEQHRLVAEIEKQLTRLDAGVTALRRAQAKLRRYKAAVFKAACEGRLVPQDPTDEPASVLLKRILTERRQRWEAEQSARGKDPKKLKYKEPAPPDTSALPELPKGWVWANLKQLSWGSGYGTSQKCDYDSSGPSVVRIPNIIGGRLDFSDMKYAIKAGELNAEKAIAEGDVLIIRTNGSRDLIGRSALVRQSFEQPYFFASYLIRFRIVNSSNIAHWLATVWDAQSVRRQIERMAATTAGQYNINITKLNGLLFPIPPLTEQHRIVEEVERRLSVVEEMEATLIANLKRAERLRQAILKQAFEGRLVPQDPDDEPASALLERIRAERAKVEGKGRRKKKQGRQLELPGM